MKKITLLLVSLFTFALSVQSASALTSRAEERMDARASAAAENQTNHLASLKARADKMITDRISSLQRLLARVQEDKKLTSSDKTSLINDINTTINNLMTLKAKIDADTDLNTARADTKSIVTTYRIFEVYEPKIRLLITINNLLSVNNNLTTLNQKIRILLSQINIPDANAKTALDDMSTQLTAINTLLASDKTLIVNVTTQTTNPQSVFVQVRKDLATVRADFAKVRADIAQLRSSFKIITSKDIVTIKPTGATQSAK